MSNPVGWFEIPVLNMPRAIEFYNRILDFQLTAIDMGELSMAWFPSDQSSYGTSGALVHHKESYIPSNHSGVLIYLNCEDVSITLDKIKQLGGKVLVEKKQISPDHGFMGLFVDSEGNRMALHSNK